MRLEADNTGAVEGSQNLDPFGNLIGSVSGTIGTPYHFTGEILDGSGLLDLRARRYAPGLGVFMSLDPFEGSVPNGAFGEPIFHNRYSYANANPINLVDPSGMDAQSVQPLNPLSNMVEPSRVLGILPAIDLLSGSRDLATVLASGICSAPSGISIPTPTPVGGVLQNYKDAIRNSTVTISNGEYDGVGNLPNCHIRNHYPKKGCVGWEISLGTLIYERTIVTHRHWEHLDETEWLEFRGPSGYLHTEQSDLEITPFGSDMLLITIPSSYNISTLGATPARISPVGTSLTPNVTPIYYAFWNEELGSAWNLVPSGFHIKWVWTDVREGLLVRASTEAGRLLFQVYTGPSAAPSYGSSGGGVYVTIGGVPHLVGVNQLSLIGGSLLLFSGVSI